MWPLLGLFCGASAFASLRPVGVDPGSRGGAFAAPFPFALAGPRASRSTWKPPQLRPAFGRNLLLNGLLFRGCFLHGDQAAKQQRRVGSGRKGEKPRQKGRQAGFMTKTKNLGVPRSQWHARAERAKHFPRPRGLTCGAATGHWHWPGGCASVLEANTS